MKGLKPIWNTMAGLLVVVLLTMALPSGAFGSQNQTPAQETKTWYVDDDKQDYPAADFTKIQDAVDAASDGDTIIAYRDNDCLGSKFK